VKKPHKMTLFDTYNRTFYPNHDRLFKENSFPTGSMTTSADRINFEIPIKLRAPYNKVNIVNKLVMVFAFPYLDNLLETSTSQSFISFQLYKAIAKISRTRRCKYHAILSLHRDS